MNNIDEKRTLILASSNTEYKPYGSQHLLTSSYSFSLPCSGTPLRPRCVPSSVMNNIDEKRTAASLQAALLVVSANTEARLKCWR
ncbi:hypothetical protein E2C01_045312 [Portunus trituberculatus]|uniref:Uncharacterized protein n=1 Tax=Portunus trituberculatus TaxID=210409 RepID=A0A5B7G0X8_PORTR|nr:hypothetical protein [Portunus trituberculatus]